ncbi:hypothetical protein [Streptomyces sp. Wb2n-11]|uniref:hypothetical protein n=1 Tax=Streptomyces sp. Wb2n-11 TaxID=1030533 RepID=UPI000ADEB142|nr:hypothetical protein [Streptomyces sp. Wb2n-11]
MPAALYVSEFDLSAPDLCDTLRAMYSAWMTLAAAKDPAVWAPLWAIAGVVVTGGFGLGLAWVQHRTTMKQAELQASRELSKWHRELRRQSYVDCLVTYERLRDMIVPLSNSIAWPVSGALTTDEVSRLDALLVLLDERYDEAFQRCQVVRLEGPVDLAETAQRLLLAGSRFRHAAEARAQAAKRGQLLVGRGWDDAAEGMNDALESFIEQARAVIAVD